MMSEKRMKPMKITSSFSKREKTLRKPLRRRNNLSISLRRLYMWRSYCQGSTRVAKGGTTGVNPRARANWRVPLPSYARSMRSEGWSCC